MVVFLEADMRGLNLSETSLCGAHLIATDLEGANLTRAKLTGAVIQRSNFANAKMAFVELDSNHLSEIPQSIIDLYKPTWTIRDVGLTTTTNATEDLTTRFQFPDHLRTACEQYLHYFSEFLQDLGTSADVTVRRKGEETLFSVTPQNKDEAIENIRDMLSFYLGLSVVDESDIYIAQGDNPEHHIALNHFKA